MPITNIQSHSREALDEIVLKAHRSRTGTRKKINICYDQAANTWYTSTIDEAYWNLMNMTDRGLVSHRWFKGYSFSVHAPLINCVHEPEAQTIKELRTLLTQNLVATSNYLS